jgi:ribosomal protein S18 acetylase RimI-like enzyme
MASGPPIEILDLRHFNSTNLLPILEAEGELWLQRLHWDYAASVRLLAQYFDNRLLPGFVALVQGQVKGYAFALYEETKAVIGNVFALPYAPTSGSFNYAAKPLQDIEESLLTHLFELLLNSPQVERVESQLLLQPSGFQNGVFRAAGFQCYRRFFMTHSLDGLWSTPRIDLPLNLELRTWRDEDLPSASQLICEAYQGHPDSTINDQYCSVQGAMRFLSNIVRYSGCGRFSPQVSHVIVDRYSRERVALILGSRVSPESGHITQICVHPRYRHHGIGRKLLLLAAHRFLRQGASEISLTVTEANFDAVELYRSEGYESTHTFDAMLWRRGRRL